MSLTTRKKRKRKNILRDDSVDLVQLSRKRRWNLVEGRSKELNEYESKRTCEFSESNFQINGKEGGAFDNKESFYCRIKCTN